MWTPAILCREEGRSDRHSFFAELPYSLLSKFCYASPLILMGAAAFVTAPMPADARHYSASKRESWMASLNCMNHQKRKRLGEMKVFVLDNSLRESTVGQVLGHSVDDKFKILDEISKCGFHDQIIGAFSQQRRVDGAFRQKLAERGGTNTRLYAFTEDYDKTVNSEMQFGQEHIPIGLHKMKKYKIPSAIIEVDVADESVDWEGKFPVSKFMEMITFILKWTHANLVEPGDALPRNMLNLRDLPIAMLKCPERMLDYRTRKAT